MDAHTLTTDDRDAYSIQEFAQRHGISRAHVYDLIAEGKGPRIIRAGARVLISREAAAEWRRRMESESAPESA